MRYHGEITISAEPEFVWQIFDDPESTRIWQPSLKSHTLRSGKAGEVGSVYELVFDNNGHSIESVATLTEKREYEVMSSTIDSESSFATMINRFEPVGNNQTRWILEVEYRFKGLYKIVALFMRNSMRARAAKEMLNFKWLVESRLADEQES
jgi:hypothetical protein